MPGWSSGGRAWHDTREFFTGLPGMATHHLGPLGTRIGPGFTRGSQRVRSTMGTGTARAVKWGKRNSKTFIGMGVGGVGLGVGTTAYMVHHSNSENNQQEGSY